MLGATGRRRLSWSPARERPKQKSVPGAEGSHRDVSKSGRPPCYHISWACLAGRLSAFHLLRCRQLLDPTIFGVRTASLPNATSRNYARCRGRGCPNFNLHLQAHALCNGLCSCRCRRRFGCRMQSLIRRKIVQLNAASGNNTSPNVLGCWHMRVMRSFHVPGCRLNWGRRARWQSWCELSSDTCAPIAVFLSNVRRTVATLPNLDPEISTRLSSTSCMCASCHTGWQPDRLLMLQEVECE